MRKQTWVSCASYSWEELSCKSVDSTLDVFLWTSTLRLPFRVALSLGQHTLFYCFFPNHPCDFGRSLRRCMECSWAALLYVQPAQHVRTPLSEEDTLVGDGYALQHLLLTGPFIN